MTTRTRRPGPWWGRASGVCGTVADVDNLWLQKIAENPGHSAWYVERFRTMAREGADLGGEARLIDAMLPRGSRELDAGCGTGRVGAFLAAAGHDVTVVNVDTQLDAALRVDPHGPP